MAFLRGLGVIERLCYVGNCKIESECFDSGFPSFSIAAIGKCIVVLQAVIP